MGLDAVELVLEIEEEFGIKIPDEDGEQIETIGQLHQYVLRRLGIDQEPRVVPGIPCANAVVFHKLRRSLIETFGIARKEIKPSVAFSELLPIDRRRQDWIRLRQALHVPLPNLIRPQFLQALLYLAWFGALVSTIAVVSGTGDAILPFSLLGVCLCAQIATIGYAVHVPDAYLTVGTTVRSLLRDHRDRLAPLPDNTAPRTVWDRLRRIISEQFGVPVESLHEDTHFINDLAMD